MNKLVERIKQRISSCYLDLLRAKQISNNPLYIEGFRCRLDELLLLYSNTMEISFIDACEELGIKYDEVNGGQSSDSKTNK